MIMSNEAWDYFTKDARYPEVLAERLAAGVEMDSAKAMGALLEQYASGDLHVVDFGAGPGHYLPVLRRLYTHGRIRYLGVDIDPRNAEYGAAYFRDDPDVDVIVGSLFEPDACVPPGANCIISANTLPHVPTITPLLAYLARATSIQWFAFRMLVGRECVQIKKHLKEHDFEGMFERDYQHNNIYSLAFLQHHLGPTWKLVVADDVVDTARLAQHRVPAQDADPFYGNRVSRDVAGMTFKGDIYMPWKFVIGQRA